MGEVSIREAMEQFLRSSRLKQGINSVRVEELWEELMGKTISKYTEKLEIKGNTLFISTQMAPLKNELLYQKEKIMERINEALGEKLVKEVVIR